MLRSLSSGVAGMKSHQTRLDVIGNNISNVNTYGFKSSRTTFSSVYYQTTSAAKASSAISGGGTNSNQIGYGANVFGIDVLMTRSGFTSTGVTTDLAIAGEGFFQVMDGEGNKYYTRNGAFNFDSAGYLVDTNGNYVLGTNGSTLGQEAGSVPIKVNLSSVNPSEATFIDSINGKTINITSTNKTADANVTFTFTEGTDFLDPNDVMKATVTNGAIAVSVNPSATFASEEEFNKAVNKAITEAYGGTHPAGDFKITISGATWVDTDGNKLTGKEIVSTDYNTQYGTTSAGALMTSLGIRVKEVGSSFLSGTTGAITQTAGFTIAKTAGATDDDNTYALTYTVGGTTYTRTIDKTSGTNVKLYNGSDYATNDYVAISVPSFSDLQTYFNSVEAGGTYGSGNTLTNNPFAATVTKSTASKALGLGTTSFQLKGGTEGGAQSVSDLTNIAIGSDGAVSATHAVLGTIEIGTITLATFENPQGLDQASSTYFITSANSGAPDVVYAGTSGSGSLQGGSLEMSNVDLSTEMSDMIITERGFQAASRIITTSDEVLQELINLKR